MNSSNLACCAGRNHLLGDLNVATESGRRARPSVGTASTGEQYGARIYL